MVLTTPLVGRLLGKGEHTTEGTDEPITPPWRKMTRGPKGQSPYALFPLCWDSLAPDSQAVWSRRLSRYLAGMVGKKGIVAWGLLAGDSGRPTTNQPNTDDCRLLPALNTVIAESFSKGGIPLTWTTLQVSFNID